MPARCDLTQPPGHLRVNLASVLDCHKLGTNLLNSSGFIKQALEFRTIDEKYSQLC